MPVSKLRAVPNNPHAFTQFRIQHNPKIAFMSVHHFGYEVSASKKSDKLRAQR